MTMKSPYDEYFLLCHLRTEPQGIPLCVPPRPIDYGLIRSIAAQRACREMLSRHLDAERGSASKATMQA